MHRAFGLTSFLSNLVTVFGQFPIYQQSTAVVGDEDVAHADVPV
jgi:hypothetical protein